MWKKGSSKKEVLQLQVVEPKSRNPIRRNKSDDDDDEHPYAFHVSGPRNVSPLNWRDLLFSTWKDSNYKRTVMACFTQAVYLLELDRQENRNDESALAPKWWAPFKYKLVETLTDERDGSIFGAILEWDRSAALSDFVLVRPNNAPRAVLSFRGTLLKTPTIRRDIEDDIRYLAWESLKGSIRFTSGLKALRKICDKYGDANICVAGHSLGAGFALQVGKALAKEGVFVETHLFNPPSVSLSSSLKNVGERAGELWRRVVSVIMRPPVDSHSESVTNLGENKKKWVPHLYVNDSDYICCYYTDLEGEKKLATNVEKKLATNICGGGGKMFVSSKGNQKFVEAHGLEQWWADDLELQTAVNDSKLISRQLKCLYSLPPSEQSPVKAR
ncbi:hypothetical protein ABFS82_08G201900 [Erythranthe guttata]|uniref:Fungal lipase-type domain-containing protein n=1 Tax=Erythranthe guttata TaxID=4155 RepID=A0A022Q1S5_ERYGU|nr:PREDICTED: GDSL esterase/lipase At4g10955-like [Erythranthe guttata]EYU21088.1 hypothetical protein MIMGU_mgv1a008107mg [Erythranthe guttata]|eukprot:XP_012857006.1 PREDICTED: GDSL esterase/lipase At4g10955-like [Erythranthe guttata]